jgi:hypothetical protein
MKKNEGGFKHKATWILILILIFSLALPSQVPAGDIKRLNTAPTVLNSGTFSGTAVGVTTDATGHVIVVTSQGNVYSISATCSVLDTATLSGAGNPTAVTMDDLGNIYIAKSDGTLCHLNLGLNVLHTTTVSGTPVDITTDGSNVFVAMSNGTIYKRSTILNAISNSSVSGTPTAIFVDPTGNIFVTTSGGTVHRLTTGLVVLNSGSVSSSPIDVTADTTGTTIVATSGGDLHKISNTIVVLASRTLSGTLVGVDIDYAGHVVAANSAGTVFVVNTGLTNHTSTNANMQAGAVDIDLVGNIFVIGTSAVPSISVSTATLNFGSVVAGSTSSPQQFTIQNAGTASLTFNISSNNTMFSASPASGSVTSSGSQTINVTFSPPSGTSAGGQSGTLTITHNDTSKPPQTVSVSGNVTVPAASISVSPTVINFMSVVEGTTSTKQFTIQNSGTAPLTFSISSNNSMYSASPSSGTVSAPGSQTINVTFAPPTGTPAGSQPGMLTITHNDTSKPPQTVSLSGNVLLAVPSINVTPTSLNFGSVVEGTTSTKTFAVQNTGTAALTFSITSNNNMYSVSPSSGSVSASSSQTINVTFAPPTGTPAGSQPGTLTITHNDTSKPPQTVALSATVVAATRIIGVTPTSLDFGKVGIYYKLTKVITVSNTGNSALTVSGSSITPSGSGFQVETAFPFTLAPSGGQKTVEITFSPVAVGVKNGQLAFTSNATNTSPTVSLTGEGVTPPQVDAFLVLDRSGSMSESAGSSLTKMDRLKSAVGLFIDLARAGQGDKLGIVQFDHPTSDYVTHLSAITASSKMAMKNSVNALVASGWTSIGKGLELAFTELTDPAVSTAGYRVLLLLSDGMENRAPFVDPANGTPVITIPSQPTIKIFTVGFGLAENMNTSLLSNLAFNSVGTTKGYFHLTHNNWYTLHKYFISILSDTFNQYVTLDPEFKITMGEIVTIPVTIVDSDKGATFAVYWTHRASSLRVELLSPDGTVITPETASSLGAEYVAGDLYAYYRVSFLPPETHRREQAEHMEGSRRKKFGTWTVAVTGQRIPYGIGKETFSASIMVPSDLSFKPETNKGVYSTGEVVLLSAELLERGRPTKAGKVAVTIESPNEGMGNMLSAQKLSPQDLDIKLGLNADTISDPRLYKVAVLHHKLQKPLISYREEEIYLYDDGLHGDGAAADGTWANYYAATKTEGVYTFRFQAAVTTKLGESTTREKTISTFVAVGKIDLNMTKIFVALQPTGIHGYSDYKITLIPKDSLGNHLGPGYSRLIELNADDMDFVSPITDDGAGGYTATLRIPSRKNVEEVIIAMGYLDSRIKFNLGETLKKQKEMEKRELK